MLIYIFVITNLFAYVLCATLPGLYEQIIAPNKQQIDKNWITLTFTDFNFKKNKKRQLILNTGLLSKFSWYKNESSIKLNITSDEFLLYYQYVNFLQKESKPKELKKMPVKAKFFDFRNLIYLGGMNEKNVGLVLVSTYLDLKTLPQRLPNSGLPQDFSKQVDYFLFQCYENNLKEYVNIKNFLTRNHESKSSTKRSLKRAASWTFSHIAGKKNRRAMSDL